MNENWFQVLWDNTSELILAYDKHGRIVHSNAAAVSILGCEPQNCGLSLADIFPRLSEISQGSVSLKREAYEGRVETVAYRANQTCFAVRMTAVYREQEENGLCFAVDISGLHETEKNLTKAREALNAALKTKTEFVSNITHELRTPVNGMMGLAKNLLDTPLNTSQLEAVNIIDRCCINMVKIINDLLDFSKMEAGKFSLEEQNFSFREFMNRTMAFNVTLVNEKGLKLLLHVADDIPDNLIGDELRLTQILNNLISNAVKFTSVGHIAVEVNKTLEDENSVELFFMVIDTGIGIAKESMDKLFKSFSQVDASITRRFGGTGLGLAICKELAEMMNGSINVESEEGKGSTFSFSVRIKKEAGAGKQSNYQFPNVKFVYEGPSQFLQENGQEGEPTFQFAEDIDQIYQFGTKENLSEIKKNMDKLIICIDMENWEKAENFAGIVKSLISEDNKELKRMAFRLELTVRKEIHAKASEQFAQLKQMLSEVDNE